MADDPIAGRLAAIRERRAALQQPGIGLELMLHGLVSAEDVPRLLAAVEAVLKLHAGDVNEDYPQETPFCGECGEWVPCTTTKAIERALTGKDGST